MLDKKRIKEVMISYGNTVGYPDKIGPKEFLENHINPLFKVLLIKKLVKPEHYDTYRSAAVLEYQKWLIRSL